MLKSFYEFEKRDRTIYDSIHEYCMTEKVNEEQLRLSVTKKEWNRKPARMLRVLRYLLSFVR
ncbi:MAG: hypothetical protein PHC69_10580 [Ruminiclostridium sp.]|nr:hypothetical protein [Ruminiclostridium sp.]